MVQVLQLLTIFKTPLLAKNKTLTRILGTQQVSQILFFFKQKYEFGFDRADWYLTTTILHSTAVSLLNSVLTTP